jgi:hypothetical protein
MTLLAIGATDVVGATVVAVEVDVVATVVVGATVVVVEVDVVVATTVALDDPLDEP